MNHFNNANNQDLCLSSEHGIIISGLKIFFPGLQFKNSPAGSLLFLCGTEIDLMQIPMTHLPSKMSDDSHKQVIQANFNAAPLIAMLQAGLPVISYAPTTHT